MKGMVRILALTGLSGALLGASYATILAPGGGGVVLGASLPPGALLTSSSTPFVGIDGLNNVTFTGTLDAAVWKEAGGNLSFLYRVHNSANSQHAITTLGNSNFGLGIVDADFDLSPGTAPTYVDRDLNGSTVYFHFVAQPLGLGAVAPGASSKWCYIRTSATSYTIGSTSIIDGGVATVQTYAPVPEPASLIALVGPAAAIVLRRKRSA